MRELEQIQKSVELQRKAVEVADQQRRLAVLRYQRGLGSNFDVVDAESSLVTARSALVQLLTSYRGAGGPQAHDRYTGRRRGVRPVTKPAPPGASRSQARALRALSGVERLFRGAEARPWLRSETTRATRRLDAGRSAPAAARARLWRSRRGRWPIQPERRRARGAVPDLDHGSGHAPGGALGDLRLLDPEQPGQDHGQAPEGKPVQKGDLLILFDAAPFEEEIRRNQALLGQAEAELAKAREDLKLQGLQNREEMLAAQLRVERSDLELKDVQQGKGRVKEDEITQAVANAQRELQKAETALQDLRRCSPKASSRARSSSARSSRSRARARSCSSPSGAAMRCSASAGRSSSARPARTRSRAARRCASSRARAPTAWPRSRRRSPPRRAGSRRPRPARAREQQLARCEVRAEVPGIVVYKDVFFGSEQRKPQVGDQVWANQPLVILPDVSRMEVETRVRETDVHKVERNQKVSVRVEAYPDLRLSGRSRWWGRWRRRRRSGAAPSSSRCAC